MDKGSIFFKKQIDRLENTCCKHSAHLSAPEAKVVEEKFQRLGHVEKGNKLVGWSLTKPRDNSMYHIGEGGTSLNKMNNHIKKK
jgi:hypothetical protein